MITDAHRVLVRKHLESLPPFPDNTLEADFLKGSMGPLSERHFVINWLDKMYAEEAANRLAVSNSYKVTNHG